MRSPAHSPGFTLLELLVVMFIIGIIAAMATLSIGVATSETGIRKEVQRIADLLALAREESVLRGREFGLTFYTRQYEFTAFDPTTASWEPLAGDDQMFALRKLPPESRLELEIDGRIVKLLDERPLQKKKVADREVEQKQPTGTGSGKTRDEKNDSLPQIFILSSGDITPFAVHVRPAIGSPGIRLEVAASGATKEIRDDL